MCTAGCVYRIMRLRYPNDQEDEPLTDPSQRPLTGIRVIGLEQYISGPYCTMLLADAGAEVIKIERPGTGDPRRAIPPFVERDGIKKAGGFLSYNRNKKSLALNLRSPTGQEILRQLVAVSDVVVENLRPGATTKMGLDYDSLKVINSRLIYAVISGFGRLPGYQTAYSERPAFDIVAEAMSGIMDLVGFADKPPTYTLYGMADVYSGVVTAYGIMQALFMRERTGQGQMVDSAMLDNMLALNERGLIAFVDPTDDEDRLEGKLQILNFRHVDPPLVARLLSAVSIVGIGEFLSGDDMAFMKLLADFTYTDTRIDIARVFANSLAIAYYAEGYIDLAENWVQIKADVAPFEPINRLLRSFPGQVGRMLVGVDKKGIVAFPMLIEGPLDAPTYSPEVSLKPIAPGILRAFVEMIENGPKDLSINNRLKSRGEFEDK